MSIVMGIALIGVVLIIVATVMGRVSVVACVALCVAILLIAFIFTRFFGTP